LEAYSVFHHFEKAKFAAYPFRDKKYDKASETSTNPALNK
jgi:hypothetical protein